MIDNDAHTIHSLFFLRQVRFKSYIILLIILLVSKEQLFAKKSECLKQNWKQVNPEPFCYAVFKISKDLIHVYWVSGSGLGLN